jgi:hypothetical protein
MTMTPVISERAVTDPVGTKGQQVRAVLSLVVGSQHYVKNEDWTAEFYDWSTDPTEASDLARTPAGQEQIRRFQSLPAVRAILEPDSPAVGAYRSARVPQ